MSREAFHLLLERYLQNRCTDEEIEIVERWYVLLDKEDLQHIDPAETIVLEQKLWEKIHGDAIIQNAEIPVGRNKIIFKSSKTWMTAAALIAGMVIITSYAYFAAKAKKPEFMITTNRIKVIEYVNNKRHPVSIEMEDGSLIVLQPYSKLKYPEHFYKSVREVSLVGEGHFLITKNPARPFLVYNRNVITRVVGTSFIVKANSKTNETEVRVETGKVIVLPNSGSIVFNLKNMLKSGKRVVLTPNQKTVYNATDNTFETTVVQQPLPIINESSKLSVKENYLFKETRVGDILNQLKKSYGIDIMAENKELYNYTFTGDLSKQNLYKQLDFLCESINATYQVEGTRIIIRGK